MHTETNFLKKYEKKFQFWYVVCNKKVEAIFCFPSVKTYDPVKCCFGFWKTACKY